MKSAQRYEAILVIALVILFGLVGLWKLPGAMPRSWEGWVPWRTALAEDLTVAMPHAALAKASYGYVEHDLLNQGLEGVLIGRNKTLFTNQDLPQFRQDALEIEAQLLDFISASAAQVEARGTRLVLVLMPDKRRMVPDAFPHPVPSWLSERYDRVFAALQTRGLDVLRADQALRPLGSAAFLKADTHWSLDGAHAVAAQVAAHVRIAYPALADTSPHERDDEDLEVLDWAGDLRAFIPLSEDRAERLYPTEPIARPYIAALNYSDISPAITVLGTSYTGFRNADVDDPWLFTDFLRFELGAHIALCSDWGEGVEEPFVSYWQQVDQGIISTPKLLIWEVPERYFGYRIAQQDVEALGSLFESAEDQACD